MINNNQNQITENVSEIDNCVSLIESYPDKRNPYISLYDSVLRVLTNLSDKEEKKGLFSHNIQGKLGNSYLVNYLSIIGISVINVIDIRNINENPVVKKYTTGYGWGVKSPSSIIRKVDTEKHLEEIVKKNKFWKPI